MYSSNQRYSIMPNRLFLFAGYDKDATIDDALIYYVSTLSEYGDVIVCMDNDLKKSEIDKLKPYTITTIANRHGEYDFGSYKRAYTYAYDKNLLKNYDYVYFINDSVFGPMIDINNILIQLEKLSTDAAGLIVSKHRTHEFMESWFVRLNKKIFTSSWFYEFISSVQSEKNKTDITVKYEHGLSNIIKKNGCSWDGIFAVYGRKTYNNPKSLFIHGCPFVKKMSFIRHNGALGNQIKYILNHSDKKSVQSVLKTANRVYGKQYMNWFLTDNPIKILWRNMTYGIKKIKNGKL